MQEREERGSKYRCGRRIHAQYEEEEGIDASSVHEHEHNNDHIYTEKTRK